MSIIVVDNFISLADLKKLAEERFGDMVKGVADLEKGIMAVGGELHADEEAVLLVNGSAQENLWGFNIYIDKGQKDWLEFDSMINIKPSQNNNSRNIESNDIRNKISQIVSNLVKT